MDGVAAIQAVPDRRRGEVARPADPDDSDRIHLPLLKGLMTELATGGRQPPAPLTVFNTVSRTCKAKVPHHQPFGSSLVTDDNCVSLHLESLKHHCLLKWRPAFDSGGGSHASLYMKPGGGVSLACSISRLVRQQAMHDDGGDSSRLDKRRHDRAALRQSIPPSAII